MSLSQSNQTFFGMDIRALVRDLGQAWGRLRESPIFAWLTPAVEVLWTRASGAQQVWQTDGRHFQPQARALAPGRVVRFFAAEPPEDMLLRRRVTMPRMPQAAMEQAVTLNVRSSSPFAPNDLVWGWVADSGEGQAQVTIEMVLASRKGIEQHLAAHSPENAPNPEIWCDRGDGTEPIVLRHFGQTQRHAVQHRAKVINAWLLGTVCLLLVALAITPTLQLRARAIQAVASYETLARAAAPAVKQREALVLSQTQLSELHAVLAEQVDPLKVLDMLTQAIPDDTSLHSLQIQGLKVSLTGETGNAAALIQQLGSHPALREVKAPTAATRAPGASKDSFSLEAMVDAKADAAKDGGTP